MHRLTAPRWTFLVALVVGFSIQVWAFADPWLQERVPTVVGWAAGALTLNLLPFLLFFFAAGAEPNRLFGLCVVFIAGVIMYLAFRRLAPERLTFVQLGLVFAGWLAVSYLFIFGIVGIFWLVDWFR